MKILWLVLCAALISGCAASVTSSGQAQPDLAFSANATRSVALYVDGNDVVRKSADWQQFRAVWRESMAASAGEASLPFTWEDKAPLTAQGPGTLITVTVNDYRFLSAGARFGFGVMTGNAFVDAKANYTEIPSGKLIGTRDYKTSSSAWQGVFSAMTDKQIKAICDQIVGEIRSR